MIDIAQITPKLQKLYQDWESQGLLSLYVWGSAVTADYNPATSDLDIMGIIDDSVDEKDFQILNKIVVDYLPGIYDPGLRTLFLSELQTGQPKGWMGNVVQPRLLLLDFPSWVHVAGQKFTRADFPIADLTPAEALAYKLEEVDDRHHRRASQKQENAHYYYCKSMYRVCYYLDQISDSYPFSYSNLHQSKNPETKPIIAILEKLKRSHWDEQLFERNYSIFEQFVSQLRQRYAKPSA